MTHRALLAAAALVALAAPDALAVKRRVPQDFATIQLACDAALDGDVIEISKGTYFENVLLSGVNDVTIRAKGGDKVIIDGGAGGIPLAVGNGDGILVEDIQVRAGNGDGITVALATNVVLRDCRASDVPDDGILMSLNDISLGVRLRRPVTERTRWLLGAGGGATSAAITDPLGEQEHYQGFGLYGMGGYEWTLFGSERSAGTVGVEAFYLHHFDSSDGPYEGGFMGLRISLSYYVGGLEASGCCL